LVTRWGCDPYSDARVSDRQPTLDDFADAIPFPKFVPVEDADARVSVAGYRPEFDRSRRLWHVDVVFTELRSGTPFVRLALTRLNLRSEHEKQLSPIVRVDLSQPYADRWVMVMKDLKSPMTLRIHVYGEQRSRSEGDFESQIEARIYRPSDVALKSEPLWEEDPAVTMCSKENRRANGEDHIPLREILLKRSGQTSRAGRLIVMEHEMQRVNGSGGRPRGGRLLHADLLQL
jgi:hypothetical protein